MYRVDRNNFYLHEKRATVFTPSRVSEFLYEILHAHISKRGVVVDPCVGIPAVPFCHSTQRASRRLPQRHPETLATIGDHLLRRRIDLRLTQVEVAERIGATEWTIVNWELNRTAPRLRFIPKVIEFLGYDPYELRSDTFGERIRLRRRSLGLSQRELSAALGIDSKTLYEWENGVRQPSRKLRAVIEAFMASGNTISPEG